MENLIIHATKVSPEIVLQGDGKLRIEGKIITENAMVTFEPIFIWLSDFHNPYVEFNIDLEYINTSASMQLFSLLRKLDADANISSVVVNWYYEEDDEEHLETGQLFEEKLERIVFHYKLHQQRGAA
ncbi:MAG: DUF1987 domain-containing protein [Bacteroidota bacterium]|nr:MAG: DUF1987 domain-containing protein [Bacteroidota bacterium]